MVAVLAFASLGATLGASLGGSPALAQTAGPTKYYTGVAVIGDPVEVNTSALDKLGPPPDMRQLLRQPAVVLGSGSPVTQRGAPLNGRAPVSGLTANAPTSLLAAPSAAPRSGLVSGQPQGTIAAIPPSSASGPVSGLESTARLPSSGTAPRVAALPPQAPAAPVPAAAAAPAPVPAKPEPVRVTTQPPPKPTIAETPKPVAAKPEPAPAPKPVAAAPKPTPAPTPAPVSTPAPAAAAPPKPVPAPAKPVATAAAPAPVPAKVEIPKIEAPVIEAADKPTAATVAEAPKAAANVPTPVPAKPQVASINPNAVVESADKLSIAFGDTSSELPAGSETALDRMAERLNNNPDMRVQLMGYASNSGETASESRRLSLFRALAVRTYLIKKGVRSTRMDVRALGNKTDGGESNRVDVILPEGTS